MIKKKKWRERNLNLIGFYYHLCTYGENITKPLIWLCLIIFFGSLYWYLISYAGYNIDAQYLVTINSSIYQFEFGRDHNDYINPIERTLQNIVSFNDVASIADIAIRITSAIVIGAIGITLRRRIERKFRH